MKVLLISAFPPSKHNLGVPSALPYYLTKYPPPNFQIDLIYYEGFEKMEYLFKEDLNNIFKKVTKISKTPGYIYYPLRLIQKLNIFKNLSGTSLKHIPGVKQLKEIEALNYDLIWIYPHTLYSWNRKFKQCRVVVTGPDCSSLHYELMSKIYSKGSIEFQGPMLENYHVRNLLDLKNNAYQVDKRWSNSTALIHVVGEDDRKMYEKLGAGNHCFYCRHPYFDYSDVINDISNINGKLTVLITGVNHSIYIGNYLDRIIQLIVINQHLSKYYKFSFLGNGFENNQEKLSAAGYETSLCTWTNKYNDFISKANVQLFPIVLGTGTKGKVLSALVSGLLCIGTKYAFENIHINNQTDCILIDNDMDVIFALERIINEKNDYSAMAKRGAQNVLFEHSPQETAKDFWEHLIKYYKESKKESQ